MKFTRKDLISSVITGFTTGFIGWKVLEFLNVPALSFFPYSWLIFIVPIAWIAGVNLGYFLGRWMGFFNQFGKFAAIGFTNFAVDSGVLNLLIATSGVASGLYFTGFKTISFLAGVSHSYFWNSVWVFESSNNGKKQEFLKFFVVAVISILINVGTASLIVNFIDPAFGLDEKAWANVGAVAGSAVALIFSFVGFKLIVFKKKEENALPQV